MYTNIWHIYSYRYLYEKFKKVCSIRNYFELCKTIKSMRLTNTYSWAHWTMVMNFASHGLDKHGEMIRIPWTACVTTDRWLIYSNSSLSRVISSSKVNTANYWVSHLRFHSLRSLLPSRTQWMGSSKLKSHSPHFPWHLSGIFYILSSYCRASVSHTETLSPTYTLCV